MQQTKKRKIENRNKKTTQESNIHKIYTQIYIYIYIYL